MLMMIYWIGTSVSSISIGAIWTHGFFFHRWLKFISTPFCLVRVWTVNFKYLHIKRKWKKIKCIFVIWLKRLSTNDRKSATYGDSAITEFDLRKWFARFRSGNFNLKNQARSKKPAVVESDQIETAIKNNLDHPKRADTEILYMSHMYVIKHLKIIGGLCASRLNWKK